MKIAKQLTCLTVFTLVIATFLSLAPTALAAAPRLELAAADDGDSVQLTVSGNAGKNVIFYYTKTGANLQLSFLGITDSNGSFSTTLSTAAYGITQNSIVYVAVDGQKSNETAWPYVVASNVLSLNQTSLVLPLRQSAVIAVYNQGFNPIYLSSNSNPPIANVNISGNQATIVALNYGATIVMLCAQVNSPSCASAYVTVQNTGAKAIAFSQNNATVASGKNITISVIGGTGNYTLLNNSNTNNIQASLSGSMVTLSASATSGYSAITVCSSDMSACGIINATAGNVSSSGITFSQTNPDITVGQTLSLTISGGSGSDYSISSNSDSTIAQTYISNNNNLVLIGNKAGSTAVTVCTSRGSCATEVVTVTANNATSGGLINLSQNNLWLLAGQSSSLTVSGGARPYSASGYSENILKTSFNNNVLTVTGVGAGSASVNVCSAAGGCVILSALINSANAVTVAPLSLNQTKLSLNAGTSGKILISGNDGYYISYNTNSGAATAVISGNSLTVTGLTAGASDISVCQNGLPTGQAGGQCAVVSVTVAPAPEPASAPALDQTNPKLEWVDCAKEKQVCKFTGYQTVRYGANGKYNYGSYLNGVSCSNSIFGDPIENVVKQCGYGGVIPDNATAAPKVAGEKITAEAKHKFAKTLVYGASGNEVKELQKKLKTGGFYNGAIDGRYLTSTVTAVKKYQKSRGIKQTGNVGIMTIAALNK